MAAVVHIPWYATGLRGDRLEAALAEIAVHIGVSQMQVSRLIRQSLARLRMDIERRPERQLNAAG